MRVIKRKRGYKTGLPPGTPVYIGDRSGEPVRISFLEFDQDRVVERENVSVEETFASRDSDMISWINIDGIHDVETMEKIGEHFGVHPLVREDILNTDQRPKHEDYGDQLFLVLKMVSFNEKTKDIRIEQVSLILGAGFVLSFQEREGDVFDPIRERIRSGKGRIRKMGADYLAYSLMDAVVDHYFFVLENLGEALEDLEIRVVSRPEPETLSAIHRLKREFIFLRKSVWPLRELINGLERGESALIHKSTRVYLRDVYDHTIQIIDTVETYRDMLTGMHDTYLSSVSNRMNEIMKVLTIIATIFIPLTFIAGVYGMNFEFMPELKWKMGYFIVWGIMLVVVVFLVYFFRKRKWL